MEQRTGGHPSDEEPERTPLWFKVTAAAATVSAAATTAGVVLKLLEMAH